MKRCSKESNKKKVLFVLQSIGYGGSMTSLINLLGFLKEANNISIDVLFMDKYGELLENAEKIANVLPENVILQSVTASRNKLIQLKRFDLYARRFFLAFQGKIKHSSTEKLAFELAAKQFSNMYDCVVAYQESIATKFVAEIHANKKIAWIHNDFDNVLGICGGIEAMNKLYSSFDKIVCVSRAGQKNFQSRLNYNSDNIECVYNTMNVRKIKENALVPLNQIVPKDTIIFQKLQEKNIFKFVSSGRVVKQKRFDRVVLAAKMLRDAGINFYWFIVGNGELDLELSEMIIEEELESCIFLTGGLKNPFPIVNCCDVFVLTSDFEAHPMVANEALILGKPVISTNFESATEVIVHEKNGLICEMDPKQIAIACQNVIENKSLFENLKREAGKFEYRNEEIVKKVIQIIGE